MAVLQDAERASLWAHLMSNFRDFLGIGEDTAASKLEVRQLIDDLDAWMDANTAAANTAIRAGIRGKFSSTEKFRALALVAAKRGGLKKVGG